MLAARELGCFVGVIWSAWSSSKTHGMVSFVRCSSSRRSERSTCGIERAASAMMAAFRASVLISPVCRSAMRRIVRMGRYATRISSALGTVTGNAPMVVSWSTTSCSLLCSLRLGISVRSLVSSFGRALSSKRSRTLLRAIAWC